MTIETLERLKTRTPKQRLQWLKVKAAGFAVVSAYRAGLLEGEAECLMNRGNGEIDAIKAAQIAQQGMSLRGIAEGVLRGYCIAEWVQTGDSDSDQRMGAHIELMQNLSGTELNREMVAAVMDLIEGPVESYVSEAEPSEWMQQVCEASQLAHCLGALEGATTKAREMHEEEHGDASEMQYETATADSLRAQIKERLEELGF